MLQVYAFGKLRMRCGNKMVEAFPTRHVEELLGYLILNPQAAHPREKLIDLLWPTSVSGNDRGRFSTVLWRLRSSFERIGVSTDAYIRVTRETVSFAPQEPFSVDFVDFEKYVASARKAPAPSEQERALQAAVDIYRGELYDGMYADWCLVERERLARLYLRTMGQLMACLIARQAFAEAVTLGREILQRDPLREEVHRAIMHCYWQMGQRAQAVQQFQACARLLRDELQVLPMRETIALYSQIVADRLQHSGVQATFTDNPTYLAFQNFLEAGSRLNHLLDSVGAT
jgi:DNA-binding SARP family transcriptional activator